MKQTKECGTQKWECLMKGIYQSVEAICQNNPAQGILKMPVFKIWEGLCLTLEEAATVGTWLNEFLLQHWDFHGKTWLGGIPNTVFNDLQ